MTDLYNKLKRQERYQQEVELVRYMYYDEELNKLEISRRLNKSVTWITAKLGGSNRYRVKL